MHTPLSTLAHVRYDRVIVWFECFVLVALFFTYMYFLVGSVVEIVLHKEVLVSIQETESRVGELEAAYFSHLDTLTPAMLPEYGLVAAAPHAYVTVSPAIDRLTKRD